MAEAATDLHSDRRASELAQDLAGRITPDAAAMARNLTAVGVLIHAEALSFALAMPRPKAQAAVKRPCREVEATGTVLPNLAVRDFPSTD